MSLLNDFAKYGLEEYIPRYINSEIEEKPSLCDLEDEERWECEKGWKENKDPYEPDFDEWFYEVEDDDYSINDNRRFEYFTSSPHTEYRFDTIGDLKGFFDKEYMSNEEFLNLSLNELVGLPVQYMKYIDPDIVDSEKFDLVDFIEVLNDEKTKKLVPDPKQRVQYSVMYVLTKADEIKGPYVSHELSGVGYTHPADVKEKVKEYVKRILLNHDDYEASRLIQLLSDYYRFWPSAKYIDIKRQENGEKPYGYPICPKPSHLKDYHDKAMRDNAQFVSRKGQKKEAVFDEGIKNIISSQDYKRLLYENGEFAIIAPQNADDLRDEGSFLNHCVGSYVTKFSEGKSYIYFLRRKTKIKEPYFTMEVIHKKGVYRLLQCYTYNDTIKKDDSTADFIAKWAKRKKVKIDCYL